MIYLDNSATTKPSETALARLKKGYECFGNPSSLHSAGFEAEKLITAAREELLSALSVRDTSAYRVIFTASGTEADNLAILGSAYAKKFRFKPKIITTNCEHPAVLMPLEKLEKEGFEIVRLSTKGGVIDKNEFISALDERCVLISIMTVNNETGAIFNIKELFTIAKRINPAVITHTDCVQGFLKIPFSLPASSADMVTVSGHKIHAPKGVGALVVSDKIIKAKRLAPIIYGGGQELSLRSGTENTAGIYALGGAASEGIAALDDFRAAARKMRDAFCGALDPLVRVNTPIGEYSPHIISITLPAVRSETMLHHLSSKGIFVSSGSACSSGKGGKSHVLLAFGLSEDEADRTLRISLSAENTVDDLVFAAKEISAAIRVLAHR